MKNIEVVAAIICDKCHVFATKRSYGDWKGLWEFPGGKIEPGETPEEALHREIREELVTEISIDALLTTVEYAYPKFHITMYCYLCKVLNGSLILLEHETSRWLSRENIDDVNLLIKL